jgi:uncharacterized protein (DUF2062 family)
MIDFVWPRRGFRKAWSYRMLRLSRLRTGPHQLSLGFAAGAFASFTPFIGFHFLLAALLAMVIRGNVLASLAGTVVGNPVTFPLIWLATYQLGSVITGPAQGVVPEPAASGEALAAAMAWYDYGLSFKDTLWPMVVGAVPLGLAAAAVCYALCYVSLQRIQRRLQARRRSAPVPDVSA